MYILCNAIYVLLQVAILRKYVADEGTILKLNEKKDLLALLDQ